jgi:hypothetical protein
MTEVSYEFIKQSNLCEINKMEQIENSADSPYEKSQKIIASIRSVQAMIVHMYQLTSQLALKEANPADAARWWKEYLNLCDSALEKLCAWKTAYPECGSGEVYDLVLDYRAEADSRYYDNTQDAEWATRFQTDPQLKSLLGNSDRPLHSL